MTIVQEINGHGVLEAILRTFHGNFNSGNVAIEL